MRDVVLAAAIVAAVCVVVGAVAVEHWETLAKGESSPSAVFRNVALTVAGPIGVFLALWRSMVAAKQAQAAQTQANTAQVQAETAQKQARVQEESAIDLQFERGCEMLKRKEDMHTTLAAIYSLGRLAKEHPDRYGNQIQLMLRDFSSARLLGAQQDLYGVRGPFDSDYHNEDYEGPLDGFMALEQACSIEQFMERDRKVRQLTSKLRPPKPA